MKALFNYIVLISVSVFTLSCSRELNLEKYRPDPKVVVNAVASTTDGIKVYVSRTWFYTDENPDILIKNAKVDLYVNDTFVEQLPWVENIEEEVVIFSYLNGYFSDLNPQVGDRVKIVCETEYGTASSEVTVPSQAVIKHVETSPVIRKGQETSHIQYKITIADPPGQSDYYLLYLDIPFRIRYVGDYTVAYGNTSWVDYSEEPLFSLHKTVLDEILDDAYTSSFYGVAFSDEAIDGKEYTLTLYEGFNGDFESYDNEEDELYDRFIKLYKIDEALYRYLYTLQNMEYGTYYKLNELGLNEPIAIPNNIEGGVGILGGMNTYAETINVRHYFDIVPVPENPYIWGDQ